MHAAMKPLSLGVPLPIMSGTAAVAAVGATNITIIIFVIYGIFSLENLFEHNDGVAGVFAQPVS